MKAEEPAPPRWVESILRLLVRPVDRDTIPGDLLEEFRVVQYPRRGAFRACVWYIAQVFSVLWERICPCVLTLVVLQVVFGTLVAHDAFYADSIPFKLLKSLWYGSPIQAPGISLFDAAMYAWAAYRAARHSALLRTGILAGAATSVIGMAALFSAFAIIMPGLLLAPFRTPFIFVIAGAFLSIALGYGILWGVVGGSLGRGVATAFPRRAV